MHRLPDKHEWIEFFGDLPTMVSEDTPWPYSQFSFTVDQEQDRLRFEMAPGFGEVSVVWHRGRSLLAKIDLAGVVGVKLEQYGGRDVLVILFESDRLEVPLRLQIRPSFQIVWGTSDGPDRLPDRT